MSFTIGRCSFTNNCTSTDSDGDTLSVNINIMPSTLAEAKAMRAQLLGMVNNADESVFPLTYSLDSNIDGFYRVLSASVEPHEAYQRNRLMRASIALERVAGGYSNPVAELYVVNRVATNSHSVSAPSYAIATSAYSDVTYDVDNSGCSGIDNAAVLSATTQVGGNPTVFVSNYYDTGGNFEGYTRFNANPATWYESPSCRLTVDGYPVVGRQVPVTEASTWAIENGVIKVANLGGTNEIYVYVYDTGGTAYVSQVLNGGTVAGGSFTAYSGSQINGEGPPVIIRNSPEMVVLRTTASGGNVAHTFAVWRGGTIVMITAEAAGTAQDMGIGMSPTVAGTNVTGGVRETATDANGNRFVILSRSTVTTSTSHTAAEVGSVTSAVFGVGFNLGASTTEPFAEAHLLDQLCAPPQWKLRVISR